MENKKHMPNSRRSVAHKNVIECRKFRKKEGDTCENSEN